MDALASGGLFLTLGAVLLLGLVALIASWSVESHLRRREDQRRQSKPE